MMLRIVLGAVGGALVALVLGSMLADEIGRGGSIVTALLVSAGLVVGVAWAYRTGKRALQDAELRSQMQAFMREQQSEHLRPRRPLVEHVEAEPRPRRPLYGQRS